MKADVRDYDQVFNALRHINEMKSYPIRGIIHSAMVLHDSLFRNLTNEILHKVMQPKIHGAWNLHRATEILSCSLEFFIMFSSIRNHITGVGQSNYNAGNNFLDSLAYWRLNYRNLPAISIALPAISGAGYLHNNAQSTIELMEQQGVHLMPSKYVFQVIEQLQHIQKEQQRILGKTNLFNPIIFSVDWKSLLTTNLPMKFNNFAKQFSKTNPEETKISSDNNEQSNFDLDTITNKIRLRISKLFGALNSNRIDLIKPLIHQGMDSLTAVELRTWLTREMSVNIPLVKLLQGMSINDLALYIQQKALQHQTNININKNSPELSSKNINDNENSLVNAEIEKHHKEFESSYNGTSLLLPLHYPGKRSTLFCIHDIIGLSQTFIQFAIQMTNRYQNECPSIFAFRASGYQTKELFLQSIETMAEQYIFQMKRVQPTGPYYLLGYSFGGLVAYEMARQLYEKHQTTVQSLILIDPPIPIEYPLVLSKQIEKNLFWSLKTLQFIFNYFTKDKTSNLLLNQLFSSPQSSNEMLTQQALLTLKTRFPFLKDNKDMFEIIKANMIAKESYTYHTAKTSNDLIKINHTIMFTLKDNPSNNTKHQIWKSLLPHLIIEDVDGTHQTLLENPSVQFIVDRLKQMFTQ
jgi:thioesterase domain-containing protein/acyl carrier protein